MAKVIEVPGIGNVEFPDSMSDADIGAAIQKQMGGSAPAAPAEKPPSFLRGAVFDPGMYNPTDRTARQMQQGQAPRGAGVLMGLAAPALAATEMVAPEAYRNLEQSYQGFRQQYGQTGMDVPRMVGELPYTAAVPELKAATAAGRVGAAAATGGMAAAMTPTQQTSGSALGNKAIQIGMGAAMGGVSGGAAESVGQMMRGGQSIDKAISQNREVNQRAERQVKEFAEQKLGIDPNQLADNVKVMLKRVAASAGNLDKLDPKAVARLNTLNRAGVTEATKGQVTRDPLQRQAEVQAQQMEGGQVLRDLSEQQNRQLLSNIEKVTGGRRLPYESTMAGKAVREAEEARLTSLRRRVTRLYRDAERAAGDTTVASQDLATHINEHAEPDLVSYVTRKLPRDAYQVKDGVLTLTRDLSLKELEIVRKAAVAAQKDIGSKGYYAGEIKKLIDNMTKDAGGKAYAEARAARQLVGEEFERTQMVNKIIKMRGRSQENAVALEDIWRTSVVNGSVEDLAKLKKSLTEALPEGTLGTKRSEALLAKGRQAFDDLRAATADFLLTKATRSPKNATGDPNVQWNAFRNAVNEIGPEKLELLFGKKAAADLQNSVEALEILKTEAPNDWKGSPTFKHVLGLLDKLGGAGSLVTGTIQTVQKVAKVGEAGRVARKAVSEPLGVSAPPTLARDYSRQAGQAGAALTLAGQSQGQQQ